MIQLIVKYYSPKMLITLDLNQLFDSCFQRLSECQVTFIPMTPAERLEASRQVNGMTAVDERFWLFHQAETGLIRESDLELSIVRLGRK